MFFYQVVSGVKLRLLKTDLNKARENKAYLDARAESTKSELCPEMNEKLRGSVAINIRLSIRKTRLEYKQGLDATLKRLSVRQDKPLNEQNFGSIRILDNISLPILVKDLLSYGPKHPIKDNFNEVHFLAKIDKLVRTLRESGTDGEKLCENEDSAKWYAENYRETHTDRGVVKKAKFLKDNDIVAVPFDKGTGFCVMKR